MLQAVKPSILSILLKRDFVTNYKINLSRYINYSFVGGAYIHLKGMNIIL
jgi:hypothetical protein